MHNNYNYPEGTDYADAPWNECVKEAIEVDVVISQSLSKSTKIKVSNYEVEETADYDGNRVIKDVIYDFTNSNLKEEYKSQQYTIEELLEHLKVYLAEDIAYRPKDDPKLHTLQILLESCEGWLVDETEVIEN